MSFAVEDLSQNTEEIDEDEAYETILEALKLLEKSRSERRRSTHTEPLTLQQVSYDSQRANPLPPGSIYGLHNLENTKHLFIQYTNDRSPFIHEMNRRFEILNTDGERVMFAVENTRSMINAFSFASLHDFDFRFVDAKCGAEAFTVISRARIFGIGGTEMRVFKEQIPMGKILQTGSYGSTVFKVFDNDGRLKFVIKPSEDYVEEVRPSFFQRLKAAEDIDIEFPEEFNIFSADETLLVGRIMGSWAKQSVEDKGSSSDEDDDSDSSTESDGSAAGSEDRSQDSRIQPSKSTSVSYKTKGTDSNTSFRRHIRQRQPKSLPVTREPSRMDIVSEKSTKMMWRFNRQRCNKFIETVTKNIEGWEWYFDGEYFGAEFTVQLGPVSRALIVPVLLIQYFRIHFDRHHRRKSSRSLFKKNFKRWRIFTCFCGVVALLIIMLDLYREQAPN